MARDRSSSSSSSSLLMPGPHDCEHWSPSPLARIAAALERIDPLRMLAEMVDRSASGRP